MVTWPDTTAAVSVSTNIESTLQAFKTDSGLNLQVYPGRPASLHPPSIWQDERRDTVEFSGVHDFQAMDHTMEVDIVALHGLFDSKDAVEQRNAFVDSFLSWLRSHRAAGLAGPTSVLARLSLRDNANYVPDWVPPAQQVAYYATVITLEVNIED
jgi:hypothetical protein